MLPSTSVNRISSLPRPDTTPFPNLPNSVIGGTWKSCTLHADHRKETPQKAPMPMGSLLGRGPFQLEELVSRHTRVQQQDNIRLFYNQLIG